MIGRKEEELAKTKSLCDEKIKTASDEEKKSRSLAEELIKRLELGERRWTEMERSLRSELTDRKTTIDRLSSNIRDKEEIIRTMRYKHLDILFYSYFINYNVRAEETVRARSLFRAVKTYVGEKNMNHENNGNITDIIQNGVSDNEEEETTEDDSQNV